jgi:hypothetical protein
VPLTSDPLEFGNFEENWRKAGFDVGRLNLKVIKTDADFNNWMRTVFGDGLHPVIDPLFDKNKNLVKGVRLRHFEAMIAEAAIREKLAGELPRASVKSPRRREPAKKRASKSERRKRRKRL